MGLIPKSKKTELASCPNTELLGAFQVSAASEHMRAASNLQPYGYTPIAGSLRAAANDLSAVDARDRMIILISDGEETCGGDPVRAAADIRSLGISVATYVVGFDLDGDQRAQMEAVAAAGDGAYFDARNRNSLQNAIEEAVGVVTRKSERRIKRCLIPLIGGRTIETAIPLLPGLYTVGDVIPEGERRYYKITTDSGQMARIRGLLQSWRTIGDTDGASQQTESGLGAFTFDLLDFDGQLVGGRTARERDIPGTSAEVDYLETTGTGFILAIGDNYDPVSSDTLFALNIETAFDGTGEGDSSETSPLALVLDQMAEAHIRHDDLIDTWRINLADAPGFSSGWLGALSLQVQPDIAEYRLRIKVWLEREGQPPERLRSDEAGSGSWSKNGDGAWPLGSYDSVLITIENREPRLDSQVTRYTIGAFAED